MENLPLVLHSTAMNVSQKMPVNALPNQELFLIFNKCKLLLSTYLFSFSESIPSSAKYLPVSNFSKYSP